MNWWHTYSSMGMWGRFGVAFVAGVALLALIVVLLS